MAGQVNRQVSVEYGVGGSEKIRSMFKGSKFKIEIAIGIGEGAVRSWKFEEISSMFKVEE
jgi:hypothetical protein